MSRRLPERAVAVLVLVAVAGACANGGQPGVRVEALQADIVFGVEQPEDAASSLVPTPEGQLAGDVETIGGAIDVPFVNRLPDRFKDLLRLRTSEPPAETCPAAGPGAAPEVTAERNTTAPPAAGAYLFRIAGTRTTTFNGVEVKGTLGGFEPRIIDNVVQTSDTQWSFDVTRPWGDGGARTESWSVNANGVQQSVNPPFVGENVIRAGEPGRGVALTGIQDLDRNGNTVGTFDPSPSLLHLPLPVLPGEDFTSVAFDVRQGRSVQLDGSIQRTQAVDACGTLADGWLVDLAFTDATAEATGESAEQWIFSTPMGGLPISQHYTITETQGELAETIDVTYSIAQLTPVPLEESQR